MKYLIAAATVAVIALLGGCSSDNVDCGLDACTVSIDRTADARVSVLGVEAKFVSADAGAATIEVAGEQVRLTKGQQAVEVAGLQVSLAAVTADQVQLAITR